MSQGALAILSLLPIATVAVFLVGMRWPASRAMPLCYGVAVALALWVWKVPGAHVWRKLLNASDFRFTLTRG